MFRKEDATGAVPKSPIAEAFRYNLPDMLRVVGCSLMNVIPVVATIFGAAYAVRECAHIRVLAAFWVLPKGAALGVAIAADALWFAFNSLMLWKGIELVHSYVLQPSLSPALEINLLWPSLLIPIGYGLMCLRMIQAYAIWWRGGIAPFSALPGG